ncbi:hypothetical protein BRC81_09280 [Halobacteriales archaeon QS_1_68_20]|nr:MAG: hypothetical protein BRC81_09280 [Halobacteriales archaeon QS_1_68_20]
MKRRDVLRNAAIGGTLTLGTATGASAEPATTDADCKWSEYFTCLDYTSGYDADVTIQDYDTSDDDRSAWWTAVAQVDDSKLKREKVQVTLYEQRCNASSCDWTSLGTATADTGDFYNGVERDETQEAQTWETQGSTWVSNYEYKVEVYNYVEWNPDYYSYDPKWDTCWYGPYEVCPL